MTTAAEWLANIERFRFNPASIQRHALEQLQAASGGKIDIVDPTNPFIFLMENSAFNAAAAMIQNEALSRKLYPSLALTEDELYLHMSDADYVDRFATPAGGVFTLLLGKEELYARALPTGNGEIRKLVIPRHTEITVVDTAFTLQYPIEIRIMAHGGLQVVYDTDKLSPLQRLTTNLVDWRLVNIKGIEFVELRVPARQFKLSPHYAKLTASSQFEAAYEFTDQFYFARVYRATANGGWEEIRTTHTDQVFDPYKPTALLKVYNNRLKVSLPQIYLSNRMVEGELRVDIYTTKGPIDLILGNYVANNFVARWVDLEKDEGGKYYAPLSAYSTMTIYSDAVVSGGRNALSFEELRERVMLNAMGVPDLPITNVQLGTRLLTRGFDAVVDVDNVTNRQFKATRSLPRPADATTVAGAGCTIQTLSTSLTALAGLRTARDNGARVTLLPDTLYQSINGVLEIVPVNVVDSLLAQSPDVMARKVNESNYLYSPFHYVLDMNDDLFALRPYYLDNPAIETKSFVEENDTAGYSVSADQFDIERTETGYRLTIVTKSGESWKELTDEQVYCQLSFRPAGEKDRAYQTQQTVGRVDDEMVFIFDLDTNYDLDKNDNLILTSFQMYGDENRTHAAPLTTDFDVVFVVSGIAPEGLRASSIDLDLGRRELPEDAVGVGRERLTVRLGEPLKGLWAASRSVVSSLDYARYAADVPAIWEETIFQRDESGAIVINTLPDGNLEYVVLHAKGDPVLDDQGQPVFRFRKGDVQLDADDKPVVLNTRGMLRQVDLFLIDGVYWFASEPASLEYKRKIPQTIVSWVNGDIAEVSQYLLEQTSLYFFPRSTLGHVPALVMEDQQVSLEAAQSFSVTFYLRGAAYRDAALRTALSRMAVEVIDEALKARTVTTSDLYTRLMARVGSDAIAVDVTGLGGATPYAAVTLLDDSARLSVKKIAVARADGEIAVEEDVSIAFIQHIAG